MILLNLKEKALINSETGELVRPLCWDSLAPYYSYLLDRGHPGPAQSMLLQVFGGEKIISKMIECSQKHLPIDF